MTWTHLDLISQPTFLGAAVATTETVAAQYSHSDLILLIVYIGLALIFSFLCSVTEAALLSITPPYIEGLKETHPKRAALLKRLKEDNIDQSLAAILTLNTIAHTVGAIGSGAKATVVFGSAWFGVFSAVMTLLILFLSEIIPKTLGAVYWRRLAAPTALFVRGLIFLLYPLIVVSEKLTKMVKGGSHGQNFSRDEFLAMTGIGEQSGELQAKESKIIRNLLRMNTLKAEDVMTPRTVIQALPENATVDEALDPNPMFSRIPLYENSIDKITGFVLKDDILLAKAQDKHDLPLHTLKRPIHSLSHDTSLPELLELMLNKRQHMVVLYDDFGGTKGLVTLEDVVETLLGEEIVDESDTTDDMQKLARQKWENRAKAIGISLSDEQSE